MAGGDREVTATVALAMGSIDVSHLSWDRPGGAPLLRDVSFHVGEGQRVALVGANGVGKTTLLRLIAGEETGHTGTVNVHGSLGVMRQLVGVGGDATTVRDLLVSVSPAALRRAAAALDAAESARAADPTGSDAALAYAAAITDWGDAGGWEAEVLWGTCATKALGHTYDEVAARPLATLSGGQQKRLVLEALLRSDADVLLLDEPDNFLDIPAKRWLEAQLVASPKTVLYVSHDRELLAATATKVVTVEASGAWTHGGGFATYAGARDARLDRIEKDRRLHLEERARLEGIVREMKRRASFAEVFAPRAKAAESRLRQFDEAGPPPERVREQSVKVQLEGGRTGRRALVLEGLELPDLTLPFDLEVSFGERVAVLGANGTGKSHFLRLLAGGDVAHEGTFQLGARVVPGLFSQTHDHPELRGRDLLAVLAGRDLVRGPAMAHLRRYGLQGCAEQTFDTLSGGQQARFQVLLLELDGATLLLLDEPTDNLDLHSAEALEDGLAAFQGTVVAVTHDRWFLRGFDRFVVFADDGEVTDHLSLPPPFA